MNSCLNDIPVLLEMGVNSKKCFLCKELKHLAEYDPDNRKYQIKADLNTCKVCKKCDFERALNELSITQLNNEGKFEVIQFENKEEVIKWYKLNKVDMSTVAKKAAVKKPVVKKLTPETEAKSVSEGPSVEVPVQDPNAPRQLSIGEQLIGCNFDIPQEEINTVVHVKMLCAELCNIMTRELETREEISIVHNDLYKNTLFNISDVQMGIVKTLTFKN
jgi:hypothetical protein